jgi:hypothetical protein
MTVPRWWSDVHAFRIDDATRGAFVVGATGSGKTSGALRHLATAYLRAGFGGLVLTAKPEERQLWERLAAEAGREQGLRVFDISACYAYNCLDHAVILAGRGSNLTGNVVALFDTMAEAADGGQSKGGGDSEWFPMQTHGLCVNAVDLVQPIPNLQLSMQLLYEIVASSPASVAQAADPKWQEDSMCWAVIQAADAATQNADAGTRADFELRRKFFLQQFVGLAERPRSIIVQSFLQLVEPFITAPFRELFSSATSLTPEDTFDGKWIIVDLPVQEFEEVGRIASIIWKYSFQKAVLKRVPPNDGAYLRPVELFADECQTFVTRADARFQSIARSAGCCTVYATQSCESLREVLGNDDAVDALLGNLQSKFFCQNGSPDTNEWATRLIGGRLAPITSGTEGKGSDRQGHAAVNVLATTAEQKRAYIEPATLATLRSGGEVNGYIVEHICYKGGSAMMKPRRSPYAAMSFPEKVEAVEILARWPAMIVLAIIRHDIGYQRARVGIVVFIFAVMVVSNIIWYSPLTVTIAMAVLVRGWWQTRTSHRAVRLGELADATSSNGISWLERLPLPWFLRDEERVTRFLDPLLVCALGALRFAHVDRLADAWLLRQGYAFASAGNTATGMTSRRRNTMRG